MKVKETMRESVKIKMFHFAFILRFLHTPEMLTLLPPLFLSFSSSSTPTIFIFFVFVSTTIWCWVMAFHGFFFFNS